MTRQLSITAAEVPVVLAAIKSGDPAFLVREGEYDGSHVDGLYSPVEFVQACAPCETCGGHRNAPDGKGFPPCPDCRIELLGPCPVPYPHTGTYCSECDGTGAVTLGHAYAVREPLHQDDGHRWALQVQVVAA